FPEGVEAARRQVGEVEGGNPEAADAGGLLRQGLEGLQVGFHVGAGGQAEGYAGGEQGALHGGAAGDPDATAVEHRAAAAAGGEFLLLDRVEHHRVFRLALVEATNGHGVVGNAPEKVGGPVEGVDDPQIVAVRVADIARFLPEDAVVGVGLLQVTDDFLLGGAVDVGDEVVAAFFVHLDEIHAFRRANDFVAGAAGCAQGDIDHWFHRNFKEL